MRVSLNWIKRLLGRDDLGADAQSIAAKVTLHLTEVEAVERTGPRLDGVVVGRVLTCAPHPNADRLRCCTVEVGGPAPLPIVCGAPNVAAGQTVAVATVGTTLTMKGKDGKPCEITIKPAKLRGEPSQGMICAEDELGLGERHEGIIVLDTAAAPGTPLAAVLGAGDDVLVVSNQNINHRPDLWGHLGWAREISALLGLPPPACPAPAWRDEGAGMSVSVEDPGCLAYCGAVVEGVANRESPRWMRDLLAACGLRPLGLLVDVTNVVMLELGEPMHAFDRRSIAGDRITVRAARPGETLRLLDGRDLPLEGDLLIADRERGLALAGIMGGEGSMVRDDTTQIVLEAATFAAARIRRTRVRTGVATDSSSRFEKTLYVQQAALAIDRAIALLREACPDLRVTCRCSGGEGLARLARTPATVAYDPAAVRRFVGLDVPAERQYALLAALGFTRQGDGVCVPWWRGRDVEGAHDLVEEVARLHGYHHVAPEVPSLPASAPTPNRLRAAEHRARRLLSAAGWDEVATYAFTSEEWVAALGGDPAALIRLTHPLSSRETVLRPSLLPNLAEAAARNLRHLPACAMYEIGKVYGRSAGTGDTPDERLQVCGVCVVAGDEPPFYAARDAAQTLLRGLGYLTDEPQPLTADAETIPGRSAALTAKTHGPDKSTVCGLVGEVRPELRRLADCDRRLGFFRIELERLVAGLARPEPRHLVPVWRFQTVERDFTFVCPADLGWAAVADHLQQAIAQARPNLHIDHLGRDGIEAVGDPYTGTGIPAGHKALTYRVRFCADDRTLSDEELTRISAAAVQTVEARTPARLRAAGV